MYITIMRFNWYAGPSIFNVHRPAVNAQVLKILIRMTYALYPLLDHVVRHPAQTLNVNLTQHP